MIYSHPTPPGLLAKGLRRHRGISTTTHLAKPASARISTRSAFSHRDHTWGRAIYQRITARSSRSHGRWKARSRCAHRQDRSPSHPDSDVAGRRESHPSRFAAESMRRATFTRSHQKRTPNGVYLHMGFGDSTVRGRDDSLRSGGRLPRIRTPPGAVSTRWGAGALGEPGQTTRAAMSAPRSCRMTREMTPSPPPRVFPREREGHGIESEISIGRPSNAPRHVSAAVPQKAASVKSPENPPDPVKPRDCPRLSTPESSRTNRHRVPPSPRNAAVFTGVTSAVRHQPIRQIRPLPSPMRSTCPKPPTTTTSSPGSGLIKHSSTFLMSPTFICANEQDHDYIPLTPDSRSTSIFAMSTEETPWKTHGKEDVDLAMLTGVMDGSEVHEELSHHRSLRSGKFRLTISSCSRSADARTHQPMSKICLNRPRPHRPHSPMHSKPSCVSSVRRLRRSATARKSELRKAREQLSIARNHPGDDSAHWDIIFMSTHDDKRARAATRDIPEDEEDGVAAAANPVAMSYEELVVGCADGTIQIPTILPISFDKLTRSEFVEGEGKYGCPTMVQQSTPSFVGPFSLEGGNAALLGSILDVEGGRRFCGN
ncbi:hypothetical protein JB92DRAFT_3091841 [Gautieria morchelliformis]|nr:hypothetical protein JB92DRAFT_3091841 [Gautieria morchelliformis]